MEVPMLRALALALMLLAPPVAAETLSQEIARSGIGATKARLDALADPQPPDLFAQAGLEFLGGIEAALRLRWQTGLAADWSEIPILRLPIPANPSPRPLTGADVATLISTLDADMAAARENLAALGSRDFVLEIRLADLWFDIDGDGQRSEGEDLATVTGTALGPLPFGAAPVQDPVIRFDTADAAWLSAYTHLLSGLAQVALAYDPGPSVDRVLASSAAMKALWGPTPPSNAFDFMFGKQVDRVAIILHALSNRPDPARSAAAHGHFLSMIAENRRFWALLAAETDNDREWVPNDAQVSGLGLPVPPGTGQRWLAVLAEAEAMLNGSLLVPHWRYGADAGIDLKMLFQAPPAIDLVEMIQGEGFLPYARKGPRATTAAWNDFADLVQGDAGLYAVFLN
jgi:hypothetical protein